MASRDSGPRERDFKRPKQQLVEENRAIGRRLRKAREAADLSQRKVAAALRENQSWVSKVEQGERRADLAEGVRLMRLYEVDANSILMPELARAEMARGAQLIADNPKERAGKGGKIIRPRFGGPRTGRGARAETSPRPTKPSQSKSKRKPKK